MSRTWLDLLWSPPIYWGNDFCEHSSNLTSLHASGKRHSCQSLGSEPNNILLETQIPTGELIQMRGLWCGDLCFFLSITSSWGRFSFSVCLKDKVTTSVGILRFIFHFKFLKIQINILQDVSKVISFGPVIALCWPVFSLLSPHLCLMNYCRWICHTLWKSKARLRHRHLHRLTCWWVMMPLLEFSVFAFVFENRNTHPYSSQVFFFLRRKK